MKQIWSLLVGYGFGRVDLVNLVRQHKLHFNNGRELELVKARGKLRTDATHVLAAIRVMNRLEQVAETIRAALNELAIEAAWLANIRPDMATRRLCVPTATRSAVFRAGKNEFGAIGHLSPKICGHKAPNLPLCQQPHFRLRAAIGRVGCKLLLGCYFRRRHADRRRHDDILIC